MPININIYNQKAEKVGDMKLSDKIFGIKIKESLVHQAMVAQTSNERQVLAHTKDRSEVRGGGKKPWRQKGTGRARAGSSRSPIWIGGGVTFGPTKDRNFKKKINKKMKQKAILMVFSDKVANNNLVILDKIEIKEYKTKVFNEILKRLEKKVLNFGDNKKEDNKDSKDDKKDNKKEDKKKKIQKRSILVINGEKDNNVKFSGRNLAGIEIINADNIGIVDLLKYKNIIITVDVIEGIEKRYK